MSALFRVFVLTALLIATLSVRALAAGMQAGVEAYNRGDYAAALREFRPMAEQGDADAQYYLGRMYDLGHGIPEDDGEAVKWLRRAVEHGHVSAQNHLGEGVLEDDAEAVKLFRMAAEKGHAKGQNHLGIMYDWGADVSQGRRAP